MIGLKGLDQIIFSPVPDASTVLLLGDAGVLKTTFAMESLRCQFQHDPESTGIYFSFKDDVDFLTKRFNLSDLQEQGRLKIYDYNSLLEESPGIDSPDNSLDGMVELINRFRSQHGGRLSMLVLDPINIMLYHVRQDNLRNHVYQVFSRLGDLQTRSIVVCENEDGPASRLITVPCRFLADGIIELGMQETQDDVVRYIEVVKLRGVNHNLKRFQVSYRKNQFQILGPTYQTR